MKEATKTQSNATIKAAKQATIQKHEPKATVSAVTTATAVVAIMADLRSQAAAHHEKFELQGRKAAIRLVHAVYVQYHASAAASQLDKVVAELKEQLSQEQRPAPAKSTNCGVLIRYIFKDFTPKQVYQYGRSLEIAFSKSVEPEDFIAFVEDAEGFEKLCAANPVSGNESTATKSLHIALTMLQNSEAAQIFTDEDWGDKEIARIYIAVPSGDGSIQLVNAKFSDKAIMATLDRYRVENDQIKKEKVAKAKKSKTMNETQRIISLLEVRKSKAEVKVIAAEQKIVLADKAEDELAKLLAKIKLDVAKEQLEEIEQEIESLKQQLTD